MAISKIIHSKPFVEALDKVGLLPENCQRIIIDLGVNDVGRIYYQTVMDERILRVDLNTVIQIVEEDKSSE